MEISVVSYEKENAMEREKEKEREKEREKAKTQSFQNLRSLIRNASIDDQEEVTTKFFIHYFLFNIRSIYGWDVIDHKKKKGDGDHIRFWLKLPSGTPYYQFKADSEVPFSVPILFDFLRDVSNNFKTDKSLVTAKVVLSLGASYHITYIRNRFSWPLSDRDCVLANHFYISENRNEAVIAVHSVEYDEIPVLKGVDRVHLILSGYVIEEIDESRSRVTYLIQLRTDAKLMPAAILTRIMRSHMIQRLTFLNVIPASLEGKVEEKDSQKEEREEEERTKEQGRGLWRGTERRGLRGRPSHSFLADRTKGNCAPVKGVPIEDLKAEKEKEIVGLNSSQQGSDTVNLDQDEQLKEILTLIMEDIPGGEYTINGIRHRNAFMGSEAVRWFCDNGLAEDSEEGEGEGEGGERRRKGGRCEVGDRMIEAGMIWPLSHSEMRLRNDRSLYRYACDSTSIVSPNPVPSASSMGPLSFTEKDIRKDYDLGGVLGKGASGVVFHGTRKGSGDEVAIKVIEISSISSDVLRRLSLEVDILRSVTHPNVLRLKDVIMWAGYLYIITEVAREYK